MQESSTAQHSSGKPISVASRFGIVTGAIASGIPLVTTGVCRKSDKTHIFRADYLAVSKMRVALE
jgi:hypothetical protein